MVETEIRHSIGQQSAIDTSSCFRPATSSSSKTCTDEIEFLDYLSTDFSYLRRFILASNQMVRLLQAETARASEEIQAKLVNNIEIAKETLSEAGASARPFVACPGHLLHYRQAYYNMLSAARSLVPHMKDADVKLRLRRLILPLTSTSQFRVSLPIDQSKTIEGTPLPTWWDSKSTTPRAGSLGPSPAMLLKSVPSRKRMRRSSASAIVKFASSPMSYSVCSSDSPLNPSSGKLASAPKRLRTSPYPSSSPSPNEEAELPLSEDKDAEVAAPRSPPSNASAPSPSSQPDLPPAQSDHPPSPPISYLSPQTRKHLSLLEQQQRELSAGYACRKNLQITSSDGNGESFPAWDWNTPIRPSLGGIDCNLPHLNGSLSSTPAQPASALTAVSSRSNEPTVYSSLEDEYREADENFRKGLGWAPFLKRNWVGTGGVPEPSEGLTWCTSWDDGTGVRSHPSELVTTMLATFPGEPITRKPLAESTCIVM